MVIVVAALILRDHKILIDQRKRHMRMGLYWEFPGGKINPGESPEQALERELMEELHVETRTGRIKDAVFHRTDEDDILLLFYQSVITRGEPTPVECEQVLWVTISELSNYKFPPADDDLIARLMKNEIRL